VTSHGNSSQWNTAYSWGNHASAGYAASSHDHSRVLENSRATSFSSPVGAMYYDNKSSAPAYGALPSTSSWGHFFSMEHAGYPTGNGYKCVIGTGFNDERWYVKTINPSNNHAWRQIFTDAHPPNYSQVGALSASGKASDSNKLDGIDSSQFLRSDVADVKTAGTLRFNDNVPLTIGTGEDVWHFWSGSHYCTHSMWIMALLPQLVISQHSPISELKIISSQLKMP